MDGKIVSAKRIIPNYNTKDVCPITFVDFCKQHIESCKKLIGTKYKETTIKKYGYTLTHIEVFIKQHFKRKDIELFEVDKKFVQNFEYYLMAEHNLVQNLAS